MLDERDQDLDRMIGDVATAMTSTPPDARFAEQVSARIAAAGPRRKAWARPWLLAPIAGACALVLAVSVARHRDVAPKPDATTVTTDIARRVQTDTGRPAVTDAARSALADVGPPAQGRRVNASPRALPDLPPLTIAPLEVDRLDVQPLVQMDDIPIIAIAIDRIEIAAMP